MLEILRDEKAEIVPLTRQHFLDSVNIISKENVSFKRFNDKLIVSVAKAGKLPVFTYDKEIMRGARACKGLLARCVSSVHYACVTIFHEGCWRRLANTLSLTLEI